MDRAKRCTLWVAAAPIAFAIGLVLFAFFESVALNWMPSFAAYWLFQVVFLGVLFVPGIALLTIGAYLFESRPRAGRVIAALGLIWTSMLAALNVYFTFEQTFTDPNPHEPSFLPRLSILEATITSAPFVLLILGTIHAARVIRSAPSAS
ncbi:hypothetical protein HLB23_08920 [Nocardia uniformis]|uniref:Uncharacterized protein n=1 Tax=Nocardia uniformis TaxID=53432 RepID=A0A849BTR0_9NOCA|nr:hypothetical protein [Nocardia uniformis]NNH69983.1 hypothetical protein [Nocardia uniformis]